MPAINVTVNGTALPEGLTELRINDELLWSEGTGRAAKSGLMVGSVVARKQTVSLTWAILTQAQYASIRSLLNLTFFQLRITTANSLISGITAYRSTITGEHVGTLDGTGYWRNVTVEMIER